MVSVTVCCGTAKTVLLNREEMHSVQGFPPPDPHFAKQDVTCFDCQKAMRHLLYPVFESNFEIIVVENCISKKPNFEYMQCFFSLKQQTAKNNASSAVLKGI